MPRLATTIAALICVVFLVGLRNLSKASDIATTEPSADKLYRAYVELRANASNPTELGGRIDSALAKYGDTRIGGDLTLLRDENLYAQGKRDEAATLLKQLSLDRHRIKAIDMALWSRGYMTDREVDIANRLAKLLQEHPIMISDCAVFDLATFASEQKRYGEVWSLLCQLRDKYPEGDRAREDWDAMQSIRAAHPEIPERFRNSSDGDAQFFQAVQRPHLQAASFMAAVCVDPVFTGFYRRSPRDAVSACRLVIQLYDKFLTRDELERYAEGGSKAADEVRKSADPATVKELNEARPVFQKALGEVAAYDHGHPLPSTQP